MSNITVYYDSPLGEMEITIAFDKITSVSFGDTVTNTASKSSLVLNEVMKQLDEYFAGGRNEFSLGIELNGTNFQRSVWEELMRIPYGTTITYTQLAQKLGNENAVRAVANAVAANKLAILIPCHRVMGKDGGLTGYRWGIEKKKWLLVHEGMIL